MLGPLYLPHVPWVGGWMGPREVPEAVLKIKITSARRFSGHPNLDVVIKLTEPPASLNDTK
jgi:hypothetical protein